MSRFLAITVGSCHFDLYWFFPPFISSMTNKSYHKLKQPGESWKVKENPRKFKRIGTREHNKRKLLCVQTEFCHSIVLRILFHFFLYTLWNSSLVWLDPFSTEPPFMRIAYDNWFRNFSRVSDMVHFWRFTVKKNVFGQHTGRIL